MAHYCLFQRDNGELTPLVTRERLDTIFDGTLFIISMVAIPYLLYEFIKKLWSLFTPGQQWLEIGTILIGIAVLLFRKFSFDELIDKLIKKFADLKQENEAQRKRIAGLEDENAGLKDENSELKKKIEEKNATIYSLEKKAKGLANLNVVEVDINMQNV